MKTQEAWKLSVVQTNMKQFKKDSGLKTLMKK